MSKVTIEMYKPGFFEGIFYKLAYRFPKFGTKKVNIFLFISVMFKLTRQFFHRTWNKLKAIRFNKVNLKFYFHHMFLNLMFFVKGLIGLVSLGLFSPNITGKATNRLARARRDLSDARVEKQMKEDGETFDEEATAEDDKAKGKGKVSAIQKNRIRKKNMSDKELDDEIEAKLAAMMGDNK